MSQTYMHYRNGLLAAALLLALAACGSTGQSQLPVFVDPLSPAQRMAQVEQLAGVQDDELSVQPLADAQVDDLRQQAAQARAQGQLALATQQLDQALALVSDDPALLQERAELALLAGDPGQAEQFSRRALALGSHTGPLCRRHWATIWQAHLARNESLNADSAHARIAGCTVPPIQRF